MSKQETQMTENNNTIKNAVVAKIDLGFAVIDGLMLPDGSHAVAVPQLAEVFDTSKNTFSRDLKRLLGEEFRPSSTATELGNQKINVVSLAEVTRIIRALEKKGNPIASTFTDAILQEGLERRFDIAFNVRVSEDERNKRLALRMGRLLARRLWTDTLMERHLKLHGEKPTKDQYKYWTVIVNERLFNQPHFNCNRDTMNNDEQKTIELFERMAVRMADKHPTIDCDGLLGHALAMF